MQVIGVPEEEERKGGGMWLVKLFEEIMVENF